MVGTGVGAQLGILIKGGAALQAGHGVTKVVFDKTGTLTKGKLAVSDVLMFVAGPDGLDAVPVEDLLHDQSRRGGRITSLKIPASTLLHSVGVAEQDSEHPLGKAITAHVRKLLGTSFLAGENIKFLAIPGQGIQCQVKLPPELHTRPIHVRVGNLAYIRDQQRVTVPASAVALLKRHSAEGKTVVLYAVERELAAIACLSDAPRREAKEVVKELRRMGMGTAMITGDQELTARAIARAVGITEVYAGVSPRGKTEILKRLMVGLPGLPDSGKAEGQPSAARNAKPEKIAFVGDGVNDSPALALADCGIAVSSGADVAMESADIVLVARRHGEAEDALADVVVALDLSRAIFRRIRWNFAWALVYNAVFIPVAMGLFLPWGVTMHPMLAGAAMAFSSVSVVCSSLALRRYRKPAVPAAFPPAAAAAAGNGTEKAALLGTPETGDIFKSAALGAADGAAVPPPKRGGGGLLRRAAENAKALLCRWRRPPPNNARYKILPTSSPETR
ncbi:MAG: HAD-like domain-containing protein [Olpidium bornovanus]|uniref:HAD-like domain-containing protein n=1 Tax=Olpidium bornovanus TaxID=278681 RepID=A0A8H8DL47_9FUNG|nr:MAG: HAD-like domain-containing protein [Olpidium bornovanus]